MKSAGLLLVGVGCSWALVCTAEVRGDTNGLPPWTKPTEEWKIDHANGKEGEVMAARTEEEFAGWWKGHGQGLPPKVDFGSQMVVAVTAPEGEKTLIYRIVLDDAAAPQNLLVRSSRGGGSYLPTVNQTEKPARVHVVVTPKSALPVKFVADQLVDGVVALMLPDGIESKPIGSAAGSKDDKPAHKIEYREQAEKLAWDEMSGPEMHLAMEKGSQTQHSKRYPAAWSVVSVERNADGWRVAYDGTVFAVNADTGQVERVASPKEEKKDEGK